MKKYSDKLKDPRWKSKRFEILVRDMCVCRDCHEVSEKNHVHHLYYVNGLEPWEYPEEALITLCSQCHEREHGFIYPENQIVKIPLDWKKKGIRDRDVFFMFPEMLAGPEYHIFDELVYKHAERLHERRMINYRYQVELQRGDVDAIGHALSRAQA